MPAREGDTVSVYYTLTLEDGSLYESNRERAPLLFTIGTGDALPGFEAGVIGLEPGGHATVRLAASEAYGERIEEAVDEVPIELFGEAGPRVGDVATIIADDGSPIACRVTAISDDLMTVTIDYNHPLAGQALVFDIELVEIVADVEPAP